VRAACACCVALLAVAGCATAPTPARLPGATTIEALARAVQDEADRSEHESSGSARAELARQADAAARECMARAPETAACQYAQALALGLAAREHPAQAIGLLTRMLESLTRAEAADPGYDSAGPARVRALVLIRAPGWPLGPGDPDAALAAARRAVGQRPQYPPNWLALAEIQMKTEAHGDAQASYTRARDSALALPASAARDEWLSEAERALQRH